MIDILIKNGLVVSENKTIKADIAIEGEKIIAVGNNIDFAATEIIDASKKLVLPGLIDAHVHMGCASWNAVSPNDYYHCTMAGAIGGVTTIIDFALQVKGDSLVSTIEKFQAKANDSVAIDYGLHLSMTDVNPNTLSEIKDLIDIGVPSIKMFMTYRSHNIMVNDYDMLQICKYTNEYGGLPGAHCENNTIAEKLYEIFESKGNRNPYNHALAKPNYVEAEAINRALYLAKTTGSPFYVYHLSTKEGLEIIRESRRKGQKIIAETCHHYLTLNSDNLRREDGVNYLCSPPLRNNEDQEALWKGLTDGTIAVVSTDEAGFNSKDKSDAIAKSSLENVPNGLPGIEYRLPILFTKGVLNKRINIKQLVEVACVNPAKIFGLYPQKGAISPGSDADLIIIDPNHKKIINKETHAMKTDWSPYEGLEVTGYPIHTILRGKIIVKNYQFCGLKGYGKFIPGRITPQYIDNLW